MHRKTLQHLIIATLISVLFISNGSAQAPVKKSRASSASMLRLSKAGLYNKIKGGWAGQTIGVTFGGPYEFRFNGTFIQDYQPLVWYDGYLAETMVNNPGLYDDLYMDLTFVDVFEKYGKMRPQIHLPMNLPVRNTCCGMPTRLRVTTFLMV